MASNLHRRLSSLLRTSGWNLRPASNGSSLPSPSARSIFLRSLQQQQENPEQAAAEGDENSSPPPTVEEGSETPSSDEAVEEGGGAYVNEKTGEIGGPRGPEPTRYGDWERGGRCSDF